MKIPKDFEVEIRFVPTSKEEGLARTMRFLGILFPEAVRLARLEEAGNAKGVNNKTSSDAR